MERWMCWCVLVASAAAVGCKSDLNQQLLERELRMQEDQIYQLQDALQEKCDRLSRTAGENASLRKQLGIVDADASLPPRINVPPAVAAPAGAGPGRSVIVPPPVLVPPAIDLSAPAGPPPAGGRGPAAGGPRFSAPGAGSGAGSAPPSRLSPPVSSGPAPAAGGPPALAPPSLDGVPPLPDEPAGGAGGPTLPPGRQLSYEQSLDGDGSITHVVINPTRTECFDGDGDGRSDGLAVVFEPRDADERMVTAAGDVSIVALDPAAGPSASAESGCIARWDIPAREAIGHFRRTSRARGLHFVLRWPDEPPRSDHLRLLVRLTTFDGRVYDAEGVVPTGGAGSTPPPSR